MGDMCIKFGQVAADENLRDKDAFLDILDPCVACPHVQSILAFWVDAMSEGECDETCCLVDKSLIGVIPQKATMSIIIVWVCRFIQPCGYACHRPRLRLPRLAQRGGDDGY